MRALADFDTGDAEFEPGAAKIDQCGRFDLVIAAAHDQRRNEYVRRPTGSHRDFDHRRFAGQLDDAGV